MLEVEGAGGSWGTHRSWEEVQRPSREDSSSFLCLSVHRSNQRSTSFTLSSNSCSAHKVTRTRTSLSRSSKLGTDAASRLR